MVVVGAALAGFAGLGALTGIVLRAVFTKRRLGIERIVRVPLLAAAVFLMWAFLPVLVAMVDVREFVTDDELFVILTFALPVTLIGTVGTYMHRVRPKVLSYEPVAPLIHGHTVDRRVGPPEHVALPARTLPTPF